MSEKEIVKKYIRFLKEHRLYTRVTKTHKRCFNNYVLNHFKKFGGAVSEYKSTKEFLTKKFDYREWLISYQTIGSWQNLEEGIKFWSFVSICWEYECIFNNFTKGDITRKTLFFKEEISNYRKTSYFKALDNVKQAYINKIHETLEKK